MQQDLVPEEMMGIGLGLVQYDRVEAAWAETHDRLWRAVFAWSGDPEVASDAVNEAFAQALRRGDAIVDVSRWVWRSAFRIAAGALAAQRQPRADDLVRVVRDSASLPDEVIALIDALQRLSEKDRQALVLSLVAGWSSSEIAREVGSTAGAVRVRVHRARRRLRDELEVSDE
ncbi:MAG: RNA polymerase sigma factor [Acidimicrobiales bacterium]